MRQLHCQQRMSQQIKETDVSSGDARQAAHTAAAVAAAVASAVGRSCFLEQAERDRAAGVLRREKVLFALKL